MRLAGIEAAAILALLICACGDAGPSASSSSRAAPEGDAGTPQDGGAAANAEQASAEALFRALQPDLVKTCGGNGGACHVNGTLNDAPRWLAGPDPYVSAKSYRGVIPIDNDPAHSILVTQIEHTGPGLASSPSLDARVKTWIAAELNATKLPETAPFSVLDGFNTVDLGAVMPGLDGARLVFNAKTGIAGLTLSDMRIVGASAHVVRLENAYFVLMPAQGPVLVDPTNGFVGEMRIDPAQTADFFGGLLLLPSWRPGTRVAVAFERIHLENPVDGGTEGACKSVASFTSSAVPAFKLDLGGGVTCLGCHAGADDVATNAMDLRGVGSDDARACAQARNYVNLSDKAKSQLVLTPMGQANPVHPVTTAPQAFADGVLNWIKNE